MRQWTATDVPGATVFQRHQLEVSWPQINHKVTFRRQLKPVDRLAVQKLGLESELAWYRCRLKPPQSPVRTKCSQLAGLQCGKYSGGFVMMLGKTVIIIVNTHLQ